MDVEKLVEMGKEEKISESHKVKYDREKIREFLKAVDKKLDKNQALGWKIKVLLDAFANEPMKVTEWRRNNLRNMLKDEIKKMNMNIFVAMRKDKVILYKK